MLDSKSKQRIRSFNIQFAADIGAMVFHRAIVSREFIAYLFTRQTLGDQLKDASLGDSEIASELVLLSWFGRALALKQLKGDSRAHVDLPGVHRLDGYDDLLHRAVL